MTGESTVTRSAAEFESLREREDVPYVENERTIEAEKFHPLCEHYQEIDGVVMVGLVHDGAVLLQGVDQLSPPGGHVEPGGDWAETAREAIEAHTGCAVAIDGVERVERTYFCLAGQEDTRFPADVVHYRASLAGAAPDLVESPTPPEDFEPGFVGEDETLRLEWVEAVTDEVNPNHVEHVELFLDDDGGYRSGGTA